MSYSIRRATAEDRPHIEALLAELFPGQDPGARYQWMHLDNPHGRSVVWLAVDGAEVAACASYFPRQILVEGRPVRAALGGDCWVRPKFRRRGIATALHAEGKREMESLGIEVMFGTPTPANEAPLIQNGARNIGYVTRFARPLSLPYLPGSKSLFGRGWGRARIEPAVGIDPRIDEVWRATAPELTAATVRDAAFYAWRFGAAPSARQRPFVVIEGTRPIAACALERTEHHLVIVDLVAPLAYWGTAFGAIVRHAAAEHREARALSFRLSDKDARARQLWRWGYVRRERKVINVLLPDRQPRASVFYDPSRWYVSYGDTDMDRS